MNPHHLIAPGSSEFLLFAVTPPRLSTGPGEAAEIARVTLERLRPLGLDGLVLYDIDDESDRNPAERPFPFLPTMDPAEYLVRDLGGLEVPAVVYRAVGKYREDRLRSWLEEQDPARVLTVLVGASSREKAVHTRSPAPTSCAGRCGRNWSSAGRDRRAARAPGRRAPAADRPSRRWAARSSSP
ncbi:MAG TPA: hypothetical protein VHA80_13120 [Solirubrobacterales bacterium]|nr:hypothetical protein [Solirubrobacterales bacterium]